MKYVLIFVLQGLLILWEHYEPEAVIITQLGFIMLMVIGTIMSLYELIKEKE